MTARKRRSTRSPTAARSSRSAAIWGAVSASLAELVTTRGRDITLLGVDTCRGSGPEGRGDTDAHGPAVAHGGGTMAGLLHRNILACGAADTVQLLVSDSLKAAALIPDGSLDWVHIDARHDYESVCLDIDAWEPKVRRGGWLSGDDYHAEQWPGVVAAVGDRVPDATPWSVSQWRWIKT